MLGCGGDRDNIVGVWSRDPGFDSCDLPITAGYHAVLKFVLRLEKDTEEKQ